MAKEMRLDLEELNRLERIAKRPRVLSLLSSVMRNLDSKLSKEAAPIAHPMASAEKSAGPSYVTLDKFSWDQGNEKIKDAENNQPSSNQSDQSIKDMLLVIQHNLEMQCRQTNMLQKDVETLQSTVMTAVEHVRGPTSEHVGTMSDFILLSPPVFTGTEGPFAADEWIMTLEMLLEAIKVPKEEMVSMARIQLRDVAYHWWSVEKDEFKEGVSWDFFKEKFLDQFFPETFRYGLEKKFIDLKQAGRTVEEYSIEFIRLSKFAPFMVPTEGKRVERFQQGLDVEFQMPMVSCRCTTFSSVVDAAKRCELLMNSIRNEQGDHNRPQIKNMYEEGDEMKRTIWKSLD